MCVCEWREEVRKGGWKFKNMIDKGRKKLSLLPSQFGKLNKIEIVKEKLNSARILQQPLSSKDSL